MEEERGNRVRNMLNNILGLFFIKCLVLFLNRAQDGVRQGYMGHLINIANELVDLCSKTSLGQYLNDILPEVAESFKVFKETKLLATNKTQEILLVSLKT